MTGGPIIPIFHAGGASLVTFDARPSGSPISTSITDLIEWIAARDPRPIGHWRELSNDEYTRSFAVARTSGYSIVRDIYDAFSASVGSQEGAEDFVGRLMPLLKSRGWLNGDAGQIAPRLRLIFDTNLRIARSAGRWERYQRTRAAFPYLRGVTARDERVRRPPKSMSDHTAFDGIILPVTHPFWLKYFVPLGFRCRCSVIQMTRSQLARWPGGVTDAADLADRTARLGTPVFAAPGAFAEQVQNVIAIGNEQRLPGQPALGMRDARAGGSRVLTAALIDEGIEQIADALNRIFGIAA